MKTVTTAQKILVIFVAALSLPACIAGLVPGAQKAGAVHSFTSIYGADIELQGSGLYRNDSAAFAAQAKAQDVVTLAVGIPLLLASLHFASKGSLRGAVLLAGTFAYFTYTYATYSFGTFYNPFFLVYTALFSMSVFGLIISFLRLDPEEIKKRFSGPRIRKIAVAFNFFTGAMLFLMWMGRLLPNLLRGADTIYIDHYTTLPIQVMDLGFIVPLAFLAGINLARDRPLGYLLTGIFLMKGMTMVLALGAMILWSAAAGLPVNPAETIIFGVIIAAGVGTAAGYLRAVR